MSLKQDNFNIYAADMANTTTTTSVVSTTDTSYVQKILNTIGSSSKQGKRKSQEDYKCVMIRDGYCLQIVCDGHGGKFCSKYLKQMLPDMVFKVLVKYVDPTIDNLKEILQQCFNEYNKCFFEYAELLGYTNHGSCLSLSLTQLKTGVTVFANVGDSEIILIRLKTKSDSDVMVVVDDAKCYETDNALIFCVSALHRPTSPVELNRIFARNGTVKDGRVNGILQVSRAFGNKHLHPIVSPDAHFCVVKDISQFDVMINACDGLWNDLTLNGANISNMLLIKQVVCSLTINLFRQNLSSRQVVEKLTSFAIDKRSNDNVTVIVTNLSGLVTTDTPRSNISPTLDVMEILPTNDNGLHDAYIYQENNNGWVSHKKLSQLLFGVDGGHNVDVVQSYHGPFVWAPEFSNDFMDTSCKTKKIKILRHHYLSLEHFYQEMKSCGTTKHAQVQQFMENATESEAYGISQQAELRSDWEQIKEYVLLLGLIEKFSQNKHYRNLLLSTNNHKIVQIKPRDNFWGTGSDGKGLNMLGVHLMNIRSMIRANVIDEFKTMILEKLPKEMVNSNNSEQMLATKVGGINAKLIYA